MVLEAWSLEPDEVVRELETDPEKGLNEEEVRERLRRYGKNSLGEEKPTSPIKIFLKQFKDPLVWILIVASLLSYTVGEASDAALILLIVLINGIIGFVQEYRAENALRSLKSLLKPRAKVIRGGELKVVNAEEVVPGDIVVVEEGDRVPADGRLLESNNLLVDESILTGESVPVEKDARWVGRGPVPERRNVVYMGTSVVRGRGKAVVYATGRDTEMGKIAKHVSEIEEGKTPFDIEMEGLSATIGKITLGVALIVVLLYTIQGIDPLKALSIGIALAVAAVPEGLPIVITLALSLGVLRMSKKNALVRRLKSIEVLGSVDVICTDKTGTITMNRMAVVEWWGDEKWIKIVGSCCNNAHPESGTGDPLEIALKEFSGKVDCKRISEIPFTSERRLMTVVVETGGKRYILTKGAPEVIADLVGDARIYKRADEMAERGLRVIGLAYKEDDGRPEEPPYKLAGLVGLLDPPRKEVREAVKTAKEAGIRTIMITGDHRKTALAVARMIGIEGEVITGEEIERMSEEELASIIDRVGVFARVEPSHKLKIVRALQKNGHVVAMTGDGVNDAPALKAADVGVALGNGTDVAKQVSDIILLDNNYATIVEAIREGRRIFDNIKKFVVYLLSANTGEVFAVFAASLFKHILLKPVHLLLVNIFTDGAPAVALAMDPPSRDVMKRPPRKRGEPILGRRDLLLGVVALGVLIGFGILFTYLAGLSGGQKTAWGSALLGFVILEFVRLQTVRRESLYSNKWLLISLISSLLVVLAILYLPLSEIFSLGAPSPEDWAEILSVSLVVYLMSKLLKV